MTASSSIEAADVARFAALARAWWDPAGAFAPLHALNPVRLAYIRERALAAFARDGQVRAPFKGLRLLDIGCGGGLVAEPMARLGFQVTAIDAAPEGIEAARAHADAGGLAIDYRAVTAEALVAAAEPPFDVVLALEVVEHVSDARAFTADCARLLAPGGLTIMATLNRTLRSLALGKIAAEYLLRWAPVGTHDWRKFVMPDELRAAFTAAGLDADPPQGIAFDPAQGRWRRSADTAVNFMMAATRPSGESVTPGG